MAADALWIVRHARRRDFDDPAWAVTAPRPHDPPLSDAGRAQAASLARSLAGETLDALFSSPFLRCVETAAPLAERQGLPIRLETGLSEWLNRDWFPDAPPELCPIEELARRFPRVDAAYCSRSTARYGESGDEALRRSGAAARRLAEEARGALALVGHGASVLGALAALLRADPSDVPELGYGQAIALRRQGDAWVLARGPLSPASGGGGGG